MERTPIQSNADLPIAAHANIEKATGKKASDEEHPDQAASSSLLHSLHPVDAARFEQCTGSMRLHGQMFNQCSLARQWKSRAA